jgi:hypothetical protein
VRRLLTLALIPVASALAADSPPAAETGGATIEGTEVPAIALTRDLPWDFEVVAVEQVTDGPVSTAAELVRGERIRLRSREPVTRAAAGPLYLRVELTSLRFADPSEASMALDDLLARADPDTGLSYAWDVALAAGCRLHLLHAPCTLAEQHVATMAAALEQAVVVDPEHRPRVAWCRCGGGCREP